MRGGTEMASALIWIFFAAILLFPAVSAVGVTLWARRWGKSGAPRFAVRVAYGLTAFAGLATLGGFALGLAHVASSLSGEAVDPSAKARQLAEGISQVMNGGAIGLLATAVAAGWILVRTWGARPPPDDSES